MNYVVDGYVRSWYIYKSIDTLDWLTFDEYGKHIFISEAITSIDLNIVYSRFVDWSIRGEHLKIRPWIRYSWFDVIPGWFTWATFFMINDWKLVFNPNTTAISWVLFSEDYDTGYWDISWLPIYPITVAATVNTIFKETGISWLTEPESAKLLSLVNTDLTNTDTAIAWVKTDTENLLVNIANIDEGLTVEEHNALIDAEAWARKSWTQRLV